MKHCYKTRLNNVVIVPEKQKRRKTFQVCPVYLQIAE